MVKIVPLEAPLVVGAGVAGLSVALGLERAFVLSAPELGSSWWAQGGIAAAIAPGDSPQAHARDSLAVGAGLTASDAVEILANGGPAAIDHLVALGTAFDRDLDGVLLLAHEDGHGTHRVVHADGDATGAEMMRALTEAVAASGTVETVEGRIVDLVKMGDRVAGVLTANGKRRVVYLAPAVVMATGGTGRMFLHTSNPPGINGDGIIIAGRSGARLTDLEFVEFQPTALNIGKDPMPVLAEALRVEGATLVDPHGRRFMVQHHPDAELAPRDVLARAIHWQYDRGSGAYLDARCISSFHDRFPTLTAHAMSVGLDPVEHRLPVSPAAHYFVGGIDVDLWGRTSVEGLWAVGECASSGIHGANRLASNSLLEGLVFGARVAADVGRGVELPQAELRAPKESLDLPLLAGPALEDLRRIMSERVGLVRTGDGLLEARDGLLALEGVLRRTLAGRNAVELALLMVTAARRRSESRGVHYRADFPNEDPTQCHRASVEVGSVETVRVA